MRKLVTSFEDQEEAIVGFRLFKKILGKTKLSEDQIDCAYIYLCRGEPGKFKPPSPTLLLEKLQGFDSQKARMLFGDKYKDESSEEDYTVDEYPKEEIQKATEYSESFMEEEIIQDD